jgi:hypothetical protein
MIFTLYFALSLLVLGNIGPALAAQIPEEFRGEWRTHNEDAVDLRSKDQSYSPNCEPGTPNCPERAPEELLSVTVDGVETTNTRCTVTHVAKFDACPWGRLSKRPSQRNPWGPGYNIKLQCKEKNGKTFNLARDWVIEKGDMRLMPAPGYRCILPHPTKPDLQ